MGKKRKLSRNLRTSKRLDCLTREGETRHYPKYWTLIFNTNIIVCFLHDARSEVVWLCFSDLTIITTALNFQPNTIGCMEYQILRHYKKKKSSLCFGVCAIMIVLSYSPLQWALSWPPLCLWVYPCGHPWDCSSWTNIMFIYSAMWMHLWYLLLGPHSILLMFCRSTWWAMCTHLVQQKNIGRSETGVAFCEKTVKMAHDSCLLVTLPGIRSWCDRSLDIWSELYTHKRE